MNSYLQFINFSGEHLFFEKNKSETLYDIIINNINDINKIVNWEGLVFQRKTIPPIKFIQNSHELSLNTPVDELSDNEIYIVKKPIIKNFIVSVNYIENYQIKKNVMEIPSNIKTFYDFINFLKYKDINIDPSNVKVKYLNDINKFNMSDYYHGNIYILPN